MQAKSNIPKKSIERDADPPFIAPDDVTRPPQLIGLNN